MAAQLFMPEINTRPGVPPGNLAGKMPSPPTGSGDHQGFKRVLTAETTPGDGTSVVRHPGCQGGDASVQATAPMPEISVGEAGGTAGPPGVDIAVPAPEEAIVAGIVPAEDAGIRPEPHGHPDMPQTEAWALAPCVLSTDGIRALSVVGAASQGIKETPGSAPAVGERTGGTEVTSIVPQAEGPVEIPPQRGVAAQQEAGTLEAPAPVPSVENGVAWTGAVPLKRSAPAPEALMRAGGGPAALRAPSTGQAAWAARAAPAEGPNSLVAGDGSGSDSFVLSTGAAQNRDEIALPVRTSASPGPGSGGQEWSVRLSWNQVAPANGPGGVQGNSILHAQTAQEQGRELLEPQGFVSADQDTGGRTGTMDLRLVSRAPGASKKSGDSSGGAAVFLQNRDFSQGLQRAEGLPVQLQPDTVLPEDALDGSQSGGPEWNRQKTAAGALGVSAQGPAGKDGAGILTAHKIGADGGQGVLLDHGGEAIDQPEVSLRCGLGDADSSAMDQSPAGKREGGASRALQGETGFKDGFTIRADGLQAHVKDLTADKTGERAQIDAGRIVREVGETLVRSLHLGQRRAVIQLHPPELGRIRVELTLLHNNEIKAVFRADHPEIKAVIEGNADNLRAQLDQKGFTVSQFSVDVGSHEGASFSDPDPHGRPRLWRQACTSFTSSRPVEAGEIQVPATAFRAGGEGGRIDLVV